MLFANFSVDVVYDMRRACDTQLAAEHDGAGDGIATLEYTVDSDAVPVTPGDTTQRQQNANVHATSRGRSDVVVDGE
jgi:hypothetical protein